MSPENKESPPPNDPDKAARFTADANLVASLLGAFFELSGDPETKKKLGKILEKPEDDEDDDFYEYLTDEEYYGKEFIKKWKSRK